MVYNTFYEYVFANSKQSNQRNQFTGNEQIYDTKGQTCSNVQPEHSIFRHAASITVSIIFHFSRLFYLLN